MKFQEKFSGYLIAGDSISLEMDGLLIIARIAFDQDASPDQYDGYNQAQIESWKNDEWHYAGLALDIYDAEGEILIEENAASLWGIELNFPEGSNDYFNGLANELLPEALESAKEKLAALIAAHS